MKVHCKTINFGKGANWGLDDLVVRMRNTKRRLGKKKEDDCESIIYSLRGAYATILFFFFLFCFHGKNNS